MFFKNIHKRMKIVLLIIMVSFIVVLGKIFFIEVISYDKLNSLANSLWSRNLPVEADRGKILTSDGKTVADNLTTVSLVFIPNQIKNKDEVSTKIAEILGIDKSLIDKHINKKVSIERVHPEGRRLSYDIADKISSLNYAGVYLVSESKRYYNNDNMLSHVLGYVGIDNQGLSGLELEYDRYLTGSSGAIKYYADAKGNDLNKEKVYVKPVSGMDVYLTVNYDIQTSIERELNNVVTKYNPDGAWIIVMNPNTGEILGISSRPDFNPNNYQDYNIEEINRNLAIWASYEPGSTFKILTLTAALEEGLVDLEKETFYDSGSVTVSGKRIGCWKHGGHGQQTFLEVVENSCNPGFVELGQRLGTKKLFEYIDNFGYGKKTGIDLNGESTGIIFPLSKVGPLEQATTSFGQGVSVTAIQQITAVSATINGGYLYKPYIVKSIVHPETGEIIKENKPTLVRKVISESTSKIVREALESVVAKGTGRNAYIDSYRVGGKTGTAQKVQNGIYLAGNYILSFVGFLPADDPEVIIYVAIDNPKGVTQYGGTVSAPIAKNILVDIISALDIPKKSNGLEKEYLWYDEKHYKVPEVEGLELSDAKKKLSKFSIEYSGSGNYVKSISPKAGNYVKEGGVVRVLLGD